MKYKRDDFVIHSKFGEGRVIVDNDATVVVRFLHGIEECFASELQTKQSLDERLSSAMWDAPLEVILRVQAEAIQSTNDAWGVFAISRIKLLPHQLWVCHKVVQSLPTRKLIADDVGLGKTIEGGLILSSLLSRKLIQRVLILCPAALVTQWAQRLANMFEIRVVPYVSQSDTAQLDFWKTHDRVVASLQTLRTDNPDRRRRLLESQPWDMVFIDEAHHLNSAEQTGATLGYKLIEEMLEHQRINSMVFFSGTPHRGKNYGFLSLLKLLNPDFNPKTELRYQLSKLPEVMIRNNKQNVTDLAGKPLFQSHQVTVVNYIYSPQEAEFYNRLSGFISSGQMYAGARGYQDSRLILLILIAMQKIASSSLAAIKQALQNRLDGLRRKSTKLKDIQQLIQTQEQATQMGNDDVVAALQANLVEMSSSVGLMANEQDRLQELLDLANQVAVETKLEKIIQLLKGDYADRSVLFFTEYKATQRALLVLLMKEFGEQAVVFINGDDALADVPMPDGQRITLRLPRTSARSQFLSGQARFLVSTEAGGEGIDLQDNCHTLIHVDVPWNPMRLHQRVGRLNRIGQKHPVDVLSLRNLETVEAQIWMKLEHKIEQIKVALNAVMDDPEDLMQLVLGIESSEVFDQLFFEAKNQPHERLDEWFNQKTAQLGGQDVLQAVKDMVGRADKFDYGTASALIPRVDLVDLRPFFVSMLALRGRRVKTEASDKISFLTPDDWRREFGISNDYEMMSFDRQDEGRQAILHLLGMGQKVFEKAIGDARSLQAAVATLPQIVLMHPLLIFRVFDRITHSTNTRRSMVVGVEAALDNLACSILKDWQVLQYLNRIMDGKGISREATASLGRVEQIQLVRGRAVTHLENSIRELDFGLHVPSIELLAVLWPAKSK